MQVYIPPKQLYCMNPPVSYTIESEMRIKTQNGHRNVPAVTLHSIAEALRRAAVIDGYRPSVEILRGRHVRIHFPRAVVSYGRNGDVVPICLPQVGEQCQDLAEKLTRTFSCRRGDEYAAMLLGINKYLLDKVKTICFKDFDFITGSRPNT